MWRHLSPWRCSIFSFYHLFQTIQLSLFPQEQILCVLSNCEFFQDGNLSQVVIIPHWLHLLCEIILPCALTFNLIYFLLLAEIYNYWFYNIFSFTYFSEFCVGREDFNICFLHQSWIKGLLSPVQGIWAVAYLISPPQALKSHCNQCYS